MSKSNPLSQPDIPAQQPAQMQKYIYMSKSKSVEPAQHSSLIPSSTVKYLYIKLAQRTLIFTYICIIVVEVAVELESVTGLLDFDLDIHMCIFAVELAVELECRARSTDFTFDIYMRIFAVELAVELECRARSMDFTFDILWIFTVEMAVVLECRAGSTDFDFRMYM